MPQIELQLKRVQEKLLLLLKNHAALQKENSLLKQDIQIAKKQAADQQKHIDTLKQQVDVLRLNTGAMSEADKKLFEKKIGGYLKEIDRCIAMLQF
jgi:hypothetical protein